MALAPTARAIPIDSFNLAGSRSLDPAAVPIALRRLTVAPTGLAISPLRLAPRKLSLAVRGLLPRSLKVRHSARPALSLQLAQARFPVGCRPLMQRLRA
jgi:hypothetical protein